MRIAKALIFALLTMASLAGCAPAEVPSTASRHWSLKDGFYWTWTRPAAGGCVSWLATEDWASVQATSEVPCERVEHDGGAQARGLYYFSVLDNIVFKGYWPWSNELYNRRIVYDNRGMIADILPCPQKLSVTEIEELLSFISEAQTKAVTTGEKRLLSRIMERLSQVNGDSLSSSQGGCTDEVRGKSGRDRLRADVWKAK